VSGSATESIYGPVWSPDGVLHFIGEQTGWWNLYRWKDGRAEALCPMEAEFGVPQWVFGSSTYGFASAERIICAWARDGMWSLGSLDSRSLKLTRIELPFTDIGGVRVGEEFAVFVGGSPTLPGSIVRLDLATLRHEVIKQSSDAVVDPGFLSMAEAVAFPTTDGKTAHAIHYAPRNKDFRAPEGDRPPLVFMSHGGPTGSTGTTLDYEIQFWTSRGFAVLDVNYGGSTGYGREYRRRLNGAWGVVDLDDCCNAALHLVRQGLADPERLAIRGGSAGGYTTLACLAFRDVFKAGASYYGVSDLEALARDTHKFESRYLDSIVGPYPGRRDLYVERSPINFAGSIRCPIILFQGDEDKVVPPSQSALMFEAVRAKGIPTAYVLFAGEQHGFRKAVNIKRALDSELDFYAAEAFRIGLRS
jgi:dipeptidyl aminopeptidase/acylaminoacyl peptidase